MKSFGKCTAALLIASMIVQSVPISVVYASESSASSYTLETASLLSAAEILERLSDYQQALSAQDKKTAEATRSAALSALELASSSPSILSRAQRTKLIASVGQIRQLDSSFPLYQPGKPLDESARTRLVASLSADRQIAQDQSAASGADSSESGEASSVNPADQPVESQDLLNALNQTPLEVPASQPTPAVQPQPVPVYDPQPVYSQPAYVPVYSEPDPVYTAPAPVYDPAPVYEEPSTPADFDELQTDWSDPSSAQTEGMTAETMDEMSETPQAPTPVPVSAAPAPVSAPQPQAVQPAPAVYSAPVQAAPVEAVQPVVQPVQSLQPVNLSTPVQPAVQSAAPAASSAPAAASAADFEQVPVQTSAAAASLFSSAVSTVEDSILSSLVSASSSQSASSATSSAAASSGSSVSSGSSTSSSSSSQSSSASSSSSNSSASSSTSSQEGESDFTAEPSLPSDIRDIPDEELDFLLKPNPSQPEEPQQPEAKPPVQDVLPPVSIDNSFLDFTEMDTPTAPGNTSGSLGSDILNAVTTPAVSVPNGMNMFVETNPVSSSVHSITVRRLNTTVNRKLKVGNLGIINLLPDYTNSKAWKDSSSPYNTPSLWGQCTWFAWARFYEMYGFSPEFYGNGYDCVSQLLKAHGDKFRLSNTPAAGAVFSSDVAHNHVGIVLDYDAKSDTLTIQEGNLDGVSNSDWEEAISDYRTIRLSSKDMKALYGNVTYAVPKKSTKFIGTESGTADETSRRLSLKSLRSLAFEKLKEKVFIFDKGDKNDQQKAAPDENVPEDMSSE